MRSDLLLAGMGKLYFVVSRALLKGADGTRVLGRVFSGEDYKVGARTVGET